ncbi:MAG: hypothetical protein WB245_01515 [Acidimicrobiia bacterium]
MRRRSRGLNVLNPANWGVETINAQHRASSPRYVATIAIIAGLVVIVAAIVDLIR